MVGKRKGVSDGGKRGEGEDWEGVSDGGKRGEGED